MAKTPLKQPESANETEPSFEQALTRLEEIVETLDDGNIPLADSLALFKEGTRLAGVCRSLLTEAEQQVQEALKAAESSGSLSSTHQALLDGPQEAAEDYDVADGELPL